jgi:hypothetical protein
MNAINQLSDRVLLLSDGRILEEGSPKNVTNIYLLRILGSNSHDKQSLKPRKQQNTRSVVLDKNIQLDNDGLKRIVIEQLNVPHDIRSHKLQYGNKRAEIIDCGILDSQGKRVELLETSKHYTFFSRSLFYEKLEDIILGCRIVTIKGVELFGANTFDHQITLPQVKRGDVLETQFSVTMWLAKGDYFLTFGIWGLDFEILYHRLADVIAFKVTDHEGRTSSPISLVNLDERIGVKNISEIAVSKK